MVKRAYRSTRCNAVALAQRLLIVHFEQNLDAGSSPVAAWCVERVRVSETA